MIVKKKLKKSNYFIFLVLHYFLYYLIYIPVIKHKTLKKKNILVYVYLY
jgi:hypothetical protein